MNKDYPKLYNLNNILLTNCPNFNIFFNKEDIDEKVNILRILWNFWSESNPWDVIQGLTCPFVIKFSKTNYLVIKFLHLEIYN